MPFWNVTRATSEQLERVIQAAEDRCWRQEAHARRRELDRKRESVETQANPRNASQCRIVYGKVGTHLERTAPEEVDGGPSTQLSWFRGSCRYAAGHSEGPQGEFGLN